MKVPPSPDPGTWQEEVLQALEEGSPRYLGNVLVYVVKSDSDPMGFYYVLDMGNGKFVCTCKGFRYSKKDSCKHVEKVSAMLGVDK